MAAYGLECTFAEVSLQSGAGLAPAGGFKDGLADAKASALEAEQIDAADDYVASQCLWQQRLVLGAAHQRADHGQVLPLDQCHLSRIAHTGAGMIAGQSGLQARFHGVQFDHRCVALGAHANPAYAALLGHGGDQFL